MSQLNVIFNRKEGPITIQCVESEMFIQVAYKYFQKCGIEEKDQKDVNFIFEGKSLKADSCLDLKALNIKNDSKIEVTSLKEINGS